MAPPEPPPDLADAGVRTRLIRYAASILKDEARAEDAVQDVMCKLVERAAAGEAEAVGKAWLYAAVRNRCIDFLRKDGRMNHIADLNQTEASPADTDPAAVAEHHDEQDHALAALETLPASQRDVLRLRFSGGLSYREVADATGKSVNHVGVLIHEGLKTLRRQLGAEVTK